MFNLLMVIYDIQGHSEHNKLYVLLIKTRYSVDTDVIIPDLNGT